MRLFGELQTHSVPFYVCKAVVIHSSQGPETIGFQGYPRAHEGEWKQGKSKFHNDYYFTEIHSFLLNGLSQGFGKFSEL